jgi:hypothetical protein
MKLDMSGDHPIRQYFAEALHESLSGIGLIEGEVESYLAEMMVRFLHRDGLYEIRDAFGHRLESVADMVVEGDVRLNANSFDREREVHRHIGDFLLFWAGIYPEFLKNLKAPTGKDALLDPVRQGRYSYHLVSTFVHGDYAREAPVFRKLSNDFEAYLYGLRLVRDRFDPAPR